MRFRNHIKNYRLSLNKNQKEMAEFLGITIATYNHIENGHKNLTFKTIQKISDRTGIPVEMIHRELRK